MNHQRSILFLCRHAPYGTSHAHESLDMAMAFAVFDQRVTLLFLGDGCLQLRDHTGGADHNVKHLASVMGALPLYDVERIYCDAAALQACGLHRGELCIAAEPLDDQGIRALIAEHDLVLAV